MTEEQIIIEAEKVAYKHKVKKVFNREKTDEMREKAKNDIATHYDFVKVKTVHVTTPGFACYQDMDEAGFKALKIQAMKKGLTIHDFEINHEEEPKVKEPKVKG